jgi:hypothetical protein
MNRVRRRPLCWNDEAGFFVSAIILRFFLLLALFGVAAYDTAQCVIAQVKAESVSRAAATAAADTYYRTKRADLAKRDALLAAQEVDPAAKILSFTIDNHGTVTIGAEKRANTLVVRRVGALKKYNVQRSTDQETRTQ